MDRTALVSWPTKVLRKHSHPITKIDPEVKQLAQDMMAVVLDWGKYRPRETGVALAAVQIGRLERIVVIRKNFSKSKTNPGFKTYINPEIIKSEGPIVEQPEGCLSVKDVYGIVPRYSKVTIRAKTITGRAIEFNTTDFLARVFQHEIDHTNGKLFFHRVINNQFHFLNSDGKLTSLTEEDIAQRHLHRN